MKKILVFSILGLVLSCKKAEDKKSSSSSNTVTQKCEFLSVISYDSKGNIQSRAEYNYTGKKLDSICYFNPSGTKTSAFRFTYISDSERRSKYYSYPSGTASAGYSVEIINSNGDIIEQRSCDDNGNIQSYSTRTFTCH